MNIFNKIKLLNRLETFPRKTKGDFYHKKNQIFFKIFEEFYGGENRTKFHLGYSVSICEDCSLYVTNIPYWDYTNLFRIRWPVGFNPYFYDVFRLEVGSETLTIPIPIFLKYLEDKNIDRIQFFRRVTFYRTVKCVHFHHLLKEKSFNDSILYRYIPLIDRKEHLKKKLLRTEVLNKNQVLSILYSKEVEDCTSAPKIRVVRNPKEFEEIIILKNKLIEYSTESFWWEEQVSMTGKLLKGFPDSFKFGRKFVRKEDKIEEQEIVSSQISKFKDIQPKFDIDNIYAVMLRKQSWVRYNPTCTEHNEEYTIVVYAPL